MKTIRIALTIVLIFTLKLDSYSSINDFKPVSHRSIDPTKRFNDGASINDLINAVYAIISGPAGDRDWARFEGLFHKDGYMGISMQSQNGAVFRKLTIADYVKSTGGLLKQYAFKEQELGRSVQEFGNMAQVFSSYEFTLGTPQPTIRKGVNSLNLVKENGRWYILSLIWQEETKDLQIPAKLLSKQ